MVDVPTNIRDPQYRLFCDDLQENHRRVARHTTPLLSTGNILFQNLLLERIKQMKEDLVCSVSLRSLVLPHGRVDKPRDLINTSDSV